MAKRKGTITNPSKTTKPAWQDDKVSRVTPRVTPEKSPNKIGPNRKSDGSKQ
jgi:hypothetical protein